MTITPRIDAAGLASANSDDLLLLDVRTPAEYGTAHIPGSINVPVDLLDANAAVIGGRIDRDAVLICRAGPRAERAQRALAGVGVTRTSVLEGGFEAWRDAGQDVEYGEARWDLERQVRLVAGSLVATGVLASTLVPKAKWLSAGVSSSRPCRTPAPWATCCRSCPTTRVPARRRCAR